MSRADALAALLESATPSELPALAGELARALATVLTRTVATAAPVENLKKPEIAAAGTDKLLTVQQAAERLGVARTWLYRHWKQVPGGKKLGHRTLRFDARALERWASTRPAA